MDLKHIAGVGAASLLIGGAVGYAFASRRASGRDPVLSLLTAKSHHKGVETLEGYIAEHSLREPAVLQELKETTVAMDHEDARMLADATEAQFFRMLLKIINAKKCIEVGVFTGYNSLNMALVLPEDGKIVACDVSKEFTDIGRPFWLKAGVSDKIDLKLAPASDTLQALIDNGEAGTYDFVFIDADKSGYDDYYEKALILLRRGGIIAVDNTLWHGALIGGEERIMKEPDSPHRANSLAMHRLNVKLHTDDRIDLSFLKIADGCTLCRKL